MTPLLVLVCMHTNWNWLAVKHRIYEDLCLTRSAEVPWDLKGLQAATLMSQFDLKHEENTSPSCSMAATLVPCLVNGMGSPVWSFLGLNFLHPKVDELPTCTDKCRIYASLKNLVLIEHFAHVIGWLALDTMFRSLQWCIRHGPAEVELSRYPWKKKNFT